MPGLFDQLKLGALLDYLGLTISNAIAGSVPIGNRRRAPALGALAGGTRSPEMVTIRFPRSPGSSRSRLLIDQPDLVVHAGGHIRSYAGLAYLPRLLPAGVSEEQLQ